jgi:hypothetical protein
MQTTHTGKQIEEESLAFAPKWTALGEYAKWLGQLESGLMKGVTNLS